MIYSWGLIGHQFKKRLRPCRIYTTSSEFSRQRDDEANILVIMKSTSQKNLFRILALLLSIIIPIAHSDSDDTLTVHETAIKYDCSTTPLNQPRKLSSITKGDKLTKYLLLPLTTNTKDQLCTLTRVDSSETFAGIKTYTPMSRSYTGYDWDLVQGRYIQDVSISCGIVVEGEYNGQYLCQVEVPALEVHNDGYFLTLFEETKASSRKRAARHLERAQFGTSELVVLLKSTCVWVLASLLFHGR